MPRLNIAGWRIDLDSRTAVKNGSTRALSPRAVRLLDALSEAPGKTYSREHLIEAIWPRSYVNDESLTQVVAEIRRNLDDRSIILTVSGSGYRLGVNAVRSDRFDNDFMPTQAGGEDTLESYALCMETLDCARRLDGNPFSQCVEFTRQAIEIAPRSELAKSLHALSLIKLHEYQAAPSGALDAAYDAAEAALKIDSGSALALLAKAEIFFLRGLALDAIAVLEQALPRARQDAFFHTEAAITLFLSGQHRFASSMAMRSMQLSAPSATTMLLAARIAANACPNNSRGLLERAKRAAMSELEQDVSFAPSKFALCAILALLDEPDAAEEMLATAGDHNGPLEYFRVLGFAQIGDEVAALSSIERLIENGWRQPGALSAQMGMGTLIRNSKFQKLHKELTQLSYE